MRSRRFTISTRKDRVRTEERLTDELLEQIVNSRSPEGFLSRDSGVKRDLPGFLQEKLDKRGLRRSEVIRAAHLNETFGYQIFKGQRGASRDKILAIGFALHLDLHEMRTLLNQANLGDLYSKNRRDAIIIFCVSHGYDLDRADEELYRFGEETVSDDGSR